jgi:hypothetical protein
MTRKRTSENDLSLSAGASATPARRKTTSRARVKHSVPLETPPAAAPAPEIAAPLAVTDTPVTDNPVPQPGHDAIAKLAFLYWEERGYEGGSAEEDWLRAERELMDPGVTSA